MHPFLHCRAAWAVQHIRPIAEELIAHGYDKLASISPLEFVPLRFI
jgi:hypothetical protein